MWLSITLLFMHYFTDTLEEQGNQYSSASWICISFILVIICSILFRGWMFMPFGALVSLTYAAYYFRRINRRIESASALVGDSVTPAPSPDTLEEHSNQNSSASWHSIEEHGNQDSSAHWYSIYFILVILIGIGWLLLRP
jgi:hypothetical protein